MLFESAAKFSFYFFWRMKNPLVFADYFRFCSSNQNRRCMVAIN